MRKIMLEHGGDRQPGHPPRTCGQNVHKWRGLSENSETKNATAQRNCGARLCNSFTLPVIVQRVSSKLPQTAHDRKRLFLTVYQSE